MSMRRVRVRVFGRPGAANRRLGVVIRGRGSFLEELPEEFTNCDTAKLIRAREFPGQGEPFFKA
jgi:hypothetical protein